MQAITSPTKVGRLPELGGAGKAALRDVCRLRSGRRGHTGASPCIPGRRDCAHPVGHVQLAPRKLTVASTRSQVDRWQPR